MPELPEVETIKRELETAVVGKKISEVCVHHPTVIRQPDPAAFKKGLAGNIIKRVLRRAKVLILELSSGKALTIHLKMTGQLVFPGGKAKSRVCFKFADGTSLDFNDQRLFAELRLLDDWQSLEFIKNLGPEPFDIGQEAFGRMLSLKKTKIKPLLMDQSFISGIGNLYAAEALFCAKISPVRAANSLSVQEKNKLYECIKDILKEAISCGGSSVDDYIRLSGKPGGYSAHHKVYNKQGRPCPACKTTIERIALAGRGTYFCPRCQK